MLKKLLNVLLQILGCLLFIFAILTSGLLKFYPFESSALYYLSFLFIPALLVPVFPKDKRINAYAVVVAAFMLLEGATQFMDRIRGDHRFDYQVANTTGPLRVLFQHGDQSLLKEMISIMSLKAQMGLYAGESAYRVISIKNYVQKDYAHFKKLLISTAENAPFENTGNVLMLALGSSILKDSKMTVMERRLNLFELSQVINTFLNGTGRIQNFLPSSPNENLKSLIQIDEEIINKVKSALQKELDSAKLFTEIDQQLAAGKITKSQAVAFKLRIHQFNSEL
jgi:hypothetical protein